MTSSEEFFVSDCFSKQYLHARLQFFVKKKYAVEIYGSKISFLQSSNVLSSASSFSTIKPLSVRICSIDGSMSVMEFVISSYVTPVMSSDIIFKE